MTAHHSTAIGAAALRFGLPASPEAETFVLGACLLARELLPEAAEGLAAGDFTAEPHRLIYRAMQDIAGAGDSIEYLTVVEALERAGKLDAAGGVAAIAGLTDGLPRFESIASYVSIVREKARLRRLVELAEGAATAALHQADPAADIAGRLATALLELDDRAAGEALTVREILTDPASRGQILNPHQQGDRLLTGFADLDRLTGGFARSTLSILAARPSMGKTALALNIAAHVARSAPVAYFALESSREALTRRLICAEARVDSARQREGLLDTQEAQRVREAVGRVAVLPLTLIAASGATVERITATTRRLKAGGLGLVVVDYLQLMASARRTENRTQEVSGFSLGLQRLAADLEVPVLALSQLNRQTEQRADPTPRLSDLRDSGSIEQDADVVLLLDREELRKPDREDLEGIAELVVAKHRDGPVGKVKLAFLKQYTRFETLARDA